MVFLQMARSVCSQLGLSGVRLDECVFDVAVTNDTSLAEQETFQIGEERLSLSVYTTTVRMGLFGRVSNSMFWQRSLCQ